MQKSNSLHADVCSSGAAEEASEIFYVLTEFIHDV